MKPNTYRYTKDLPEIISFLVTNKCVCRCKHCFNWADTNPKGAIGNSAKIDLTVEEIKKIFEKEINKAISLDPQNEGYRALLNDIQKKKKR